VTNLNLNVLASVRDVSARAFRLTDEHTVPVRVGLVRAVEEELTKAGDEIAQLRDDAEALEQVNVDLEGELAFHRLESALGLAPEGE
jgi:hypothetical protein